MAVETMALPGTVLFRPETMWYDQANMEKRRMFLRSYQFCKKESTAGRIRRCLVRIRRILSVRLRAIRRVRRLVWSRLRRHAYRGHRRNFYRLSGKQNNYGSTPFNAAREWFGTPCHW